MERRGGLARLLYNAAEKMLLAQQVAEIACSARAARCFVTAAAPGTA